MFVWVHQGAGVCTRVHLSAEARGKPWVSFLRSRAPGVCCWAPSCLCCWIPGSQDPPSSASPVLGSQCIHPAQLFMRVLGFERGFSGLYSPCCAASATPPPPNGHFPSPWVTPLLDSTTELFAFTGSMDRQSCSPGEESEGCLPLGAAC